MNEVWEDWRLKWSRVKWSQEVKWRVEASQEVEARQEWSQVKNEVKKSRWIEEMKKPRMNRRNEWRIEEAKKSRMKKSRSQELKMNRRNEWRIEEAKNEE